MNNIFESTEPIEEWMDKHFPELWNQFKCHCIVFTGSNKDARYFAMSFQCQMREWLHQHDHSKEVEIRALYDELHSLKQQEPKASEGLSADALRACESDATSCLLSEKLERLGEISEKKSNGVVELTYEMPRKWTCWISFDGGKSGPLGKGKAPLEAVQALEEQLKEGE